MANLSDKFRDANDAWPGFPRAYSPQVSRCLFDFSPPNGATVSPYNPSLDDCLVCVPGVTIDSNTPTHGSGGVMWSPSGSWDRHMDVLGLPAQTANARIYEIFGKVSGTMASEDGIRMLINYQDDNNHWEIRLYWYSSTAMRVYMGDRVAGTFTFRGTAANASGYLSLASDDNPQWGLQVIDRGDVISANVFAFGNNDDTTDAVNVVGQTSYYSASRVFKDETTFRVAQGGGSYDRFRVANVRVTDRIY